MFPNPLSYHSSNVKCMCCMWCMCAGRLDMGDRFTEPLETRLKFQVGVARTQMFVSFVDRCRIRDLKVQTEIPALFFFFFSHTFYFPVSAQAVVTGVVPSPPRFLPSIFIAHRVQYSHCSSIFHRVLLTHALALSASQFELKKKSQRIYTSMHSAGLELTKLTYTRLEDNLIRHRGDRIAATGTINSPQSAICGCSRLFQAILHAL